MIRKTYLSGRDGHYAEVLFELPDSLWADHISLVGDFNDWTPAVVPMRRSRSGEWTASLVLETGRSYQFRYLCDGGHWINDPSADAYVRNPHGSDNSLIILDPAH